MRISYIPRPHALALLFVLAAVPTRAQFTDDFTDGDFTASPAWSGSNALFAVVDDGGDLKLRSNSPGAANYYLSTPSTLANDVRWQWWMDLRFATSGVNYVDVYLISDNADLNAVQNGWFLRIGGTADRLELFRRVSGSNTSMMTSPDGIVNSSSSNPFVIRVERTAADAWTLFYDDGNTGNFVSVGPVTDAANGASAFFGVVVVQSSAASAVNNHFFDDFEVGNIPVDLAPPTVVSVTAVSATQVDVQYDEPLDPAFIGTYDILPFIGVSGQVLDGADNALVHVTPALALTSGNTYQLVTSGAQDGSGNATPNTTVDFSYIVPAAPVFRDLVINEIMADPSPSAGLPDVEFVELFNATTNKTFDLSGWKFSDGSSTAILPNWLLGPGDHVLLTSTASAALFPTVNNKIDVASLPSLNNDADALTLTAPDNTTIDAVNYALSWYRDAIKQNGGWTLEQINPFAPCSGSANWIASIAPFGGTPGSANSVLDPTPDATPPVLTGVQVAGPTELVLVFNEAMNAASLGSANYTITPALAVTSGTPVAGTSDRVSLQLASPIVIGTVYTVTVTGATDCTGNAITTANTRTFALPEPVAPGDLVINEVLYDPVVGGSDFVELYNRSNKTLSLAGLQLANETNGQIASFNTITSEAILLLPGEYILLTANASDIATRYPQSRTDRFLQVSMPSYNNGSGTVVVLDAASTVLDLFRYSDELHFTLVNNPEGYSLERVDPNRPTSDNTNWQTASDVAGRATPGFRNSEYAPAPAPQGELTIEPAIFSPDNDGYQDVLTLVYRFDQPGYVGNITIFDIAGREARRLMENELLGTSGAISWDGILESGSKGRVGPYIVFFEAYDLDGNVEKFRKTVTLAHRLD